MTSSTLRDGLPRSKMRPVMHRRLARACLAAVVPLGVVVCLGVVVSPKHAQAQSVTPSPAPGPSVSAGQVTGSLVQGGTLTMRVDALMPGGWEGLHLVEISVVANGSVLEQIAFDIEDNKLKFGDQSLVVGTGGVAEGEYLRASGADVVVTTGGGNLSFSIDADVVKTITDEPRFRLGVVDDFGASDQVTLKLAEPRGGGITWGTMATFLAAALFAGAFVGNLFASKRRPPPRASVYEAVQARLERERAQKTRSP